MVALADLPFLQGFYRELPPTTTPFLSLLAGEPPPAGPWRADECVALGHVEDHDGLCARCRGPLGDVE